MADTVAKVGSTLNSGLDYLPGIDNHTRWTFAMVLVMFVLLLWVLVGRDLAAKAGLTTSGFNAERALSVGGTFAFNSESGNPVYQSIQGTTAGTASASGSGKPSNFTGSFSPDTPSFWESPADRVDNVYGTGLSQSVANAFAGTPWADFESAVYPKLSPQLQARYSNASTAEKINVLTAAAVTLGLKVPEVPVTTSGMSGYKSFGSQLSTMAGDPLASKLGGN